MSLTINILVKNNEETIEETLEQASRVTDKILIGDTGSTDRTIEICKKFKAKVVQVPFKSNYSDSKNYLIKSNDSWLMFLEPYESIVSIPEEIFQILEDEKVAYRAKIIKDDLITKEIRIWHKNNDVRFKNPVFESALSKGNNKNLDLFLTSKKEYLNDEKIKILNDWKASNPMSNEPLYYYSCVCLLQKKWNNFINCAETYLHRKETIDSSCLMTKYYLSMVKAYVKETTDYHGSISYILSCIAERPLMAEFWCMLGDIYYRINEVHKAKSFYENAMILGSKRIDDDDLPIEISKYKTYPLKMIKACEEIKNRTQAYKSIQKI